MNSIAGLDVVQTVDGDGEWIYGIADYQVSSLVGQILTQLEAMGLSESQLKANKSVFNRMVYGWFEEVKDNCRTAAMDELTPLNIKRDGDKFVATYRGVKK